MINSVKRGVKSVSFAGKLTLVYCTQEKLVSSSSNDTISSASRAPLSWLTSSYKASHFACMALLFYAHFAYQQEGSSQDL